MSERQSPAAVPDEPTSIGAQAATSPTVRAMRAARKFAGSAIMRLPAAHPTSGKETRSGIACQAHQSARGQAADPPALRIAAPAL
jgi:hypothetical protein